MHDLRDAMLRFGKERYGREAVNQVSHALQSASRAETANASPASVRSLSLQGRAFVRDETVAIIRRPHADDAVKLRKWDDRAKDSDREMPFLACFWRYVELFDASSPA